MTSPDRYRPRSSQRFDELLHTPKLSLDRGKQDMLQKLLVKDSLEKFVGFKRVSEPPGETVKKY